MTTLELYCVGSILHLISWLLVAWLFPEQAIGPAGRNMRKGAEGQVENESRRVMIPFSKNNTNAPSTREETGLIIYGCCTGWSLATAPLPSLDDSGGCKVEVSACSMQSVIVSRSAARRSCSGATFTFNFQAPRQPHVWLVRARASHNPHSPVVLLPHHYYSRREPIWPILYFCESTSAVLQIEHILCSFFGVQRASHSSAEPANHAVIRQDHLHHRPHRCQTQPGQSTRRADPSASGPIPPLGPGR